MKAVATEKDIVTQTSAETTRQVLETRNMVVNHIIQLQRLWSAQMQQLAKMYAAVLKDNERLRIENETLRSLIGGAPIIPQPPRDLSTQPALLLPQLSSVSSASSLPAIPSATTTHSDDDVDLMADPDEIKASAAAVPTPAPPVAPGFNLGLGSLPTSSAPNFMNDWSEILKMTSLPFAFPQAGFGIPTSTDLTQPSASTKPSNKKRKQRTSSQVSSGSLDEDDDGPPVLQAPRRSVDLEDIPDIRVKVTNNAAPPKPTRRPVNTYSDLSSIRVKVTPKKRPITSRISDPTKD